MKVAGVRCGRLTGAERDRLLDAARQAPPNYDHVGSTLDPARWSGPLMAERHLDVGSGGAAFAAARTALSTWVPHTGIGATIEPPGQPVEEGATILVVLRFGPFTVVAPDRVVAVVDEPRRFAFAYGTLPSHPERGEESFTAEHRDDGTVRVTIRVEAVAGTLAARAVAPVLRRVQHVALRRYLEAVARFVDSRTADGNGGRTA
jgi:uncharacterized protein (UPF0548 family)